MDGTGQLAGTTVAKQPSPSRTVFEESVAEIRAALLPIEVLVLSLKRSKFLAEPNTDQNAINESVANIMLAFRHVEDARMRLGKIFQALSGGISNNTR